MMFQDVPTIVQKPMRAVMRDQYGSLNKARKIASAAYARTGPANAPQDLRAIAFRFESGRSKTGSAPGISDPRPFAEQAARPKEQGQDEETEYRHILKRERQDEVRQLLDDADREGADDRALDRTDAAENDGDEHDKNIGLPSRGRDRLERREHRSGHCREGHAKAESHPLQIPHPHPEHLRRPVVVGGGAQGAPEPGVVEERPE